MSTDRECRWSARALVALAWAVAALCLIGVVDVFRYRREFPGWFPPVFGLGVVSFLGVLGVVVRGSLGPLRAGTLRSDRVPHAFWFMMAASWICTTAVHQFFPFRAGGLTWMWRHWDNLLAWNALIAVIGVASSLASWLMYARGHRGTAVAAALGTAMVALVPNDTCANGFNYSWIAWVGGSPLMYVPNVMCLIFGIGALVGRWTWLSLAAALATCCGTLFLGLGHYLRFIW